MPNFEVVPLLVGEVCVDFALSTEVSPTKMRLGGIVHAARGLWSTGERYSVAAYCPEYLVQEVINYLSAHGCVDFIRLGDIVGAPNIVLISDVREVGNQGYEDILRERKRAVSTPDVSINSFRSVVIFPGAFDLSDVFSKISDEAKITIDVAYGVNREDLLSNHLGRIENIVISTSSDLFSNIASKDINSFIDFSRKIGAKKFLLKENRGGSRLFDLKSGMVEKIPAVLGNTANSVGVGDVFTAVFGTRNEEPIEAAWRGMQVATIYSQTTFPDDLYRDVQRELNLPLAAVKGLGGVQLTWHERKNFQIYLAAPDFSYEFKPEIDAATAALQYHNFSVRRPIQENGEAKPGSSPADLRGFYQKDVALIDECAALFAIPLRRDPGTLVEIGLAIAAGKPVITYDPRAENNNTMVICGSDTYSSDLDECLNGLYTALSKINKNLS